MRILVGFTVILSLLSADFAKAGMIQRQQIISSVAFDSSFILVESFPESDRLRFSHCLKGFEGECRLLGRDGGYSPAELRRLQTSLIWSALGTNHLDAIVVAIAVLAGLGVGAAAGGVAFGGATATVAGASFGFTSLTLAGFVTGISGGVYLTRAVDILHPTRKWQERKVLTQVPLDSVVLGDVLIEGSIAEFSQRLESALNRLPRGPERLSMRAN